MKRPNRITPLVAAWLAATIAVLTTQPALAAVPTAGSQVVRFGDLNLDSQPGVVRLYTRLRHAAEKVCGDRVRPGTRIVSSDWKACTRDAIARSVAQLDRPVLTAYHAVKTGAGTTQPPATLVRADERT